MSQGHFQSALNLLEKAFQGGFEYPMQLISVRDFQPLVDHPDYRRKLRKLIQEHSIQTYATMVRKGEPDEPIHVLGQVRDGSDGTPIANASIELIQADQNGRYFIEQSNWNPRIFAYLKTNKNGEFRVDTIKPGGYRDDSGDLSYSHIHFAISCQGFRSYRSEFAFEGTA